MYVFYLSFLCVLIHKTPPLFFPSYFKSRSCVTSLWSLLQLPYYFTTFCLQYLDFPSSDLWGPNKSGSTSSVNGVLSKTNKFFSFLWLENYRKRCIDPFDSDGRCKVMYTFTIWPHPCPSRLNLFTDVKNLCPFSTVVSLGFCVTKFVLSTFFGPPPTTQLVLGDKKDVTTRR